MYKAQTGVDVDRTFYQRYISALNNIAALSLETASVIDAVHALWEYVVSFAVTVQWNCVQA